MTAPNQRFEEYTQGRYRVSTDPSLLDLEFIHDYLARHSYWASGIPRDIVERSIHHSLCFGLFDDGKQIGLARVITDQATHAWLADVFIVETCRGQKLGVWLMECVRAHPALQNLRRFMLATRDAHALYRKFGFTEVNAPQNLMEIVRPNVYQRTEEKGAASDPAPTVKS
jgi:GNAT superfamily N-acetyltransferase